MNSARDDLALPRPGFPIRTSSDQRLLSGSPKLIAASHDLHRLLAPRHATCALSSLTMLATPHHSTEAWWTDARRRQSYHALALFRLPFEFSKNRCDRALRSPRKPPRPPRASHHAGWS